MAHFQEDDRKNNRFGSLWIHGYIFGPLDTGSKTVKMDPNDPNDQFFSYFCWIFSKKKNVKFFIKEKNCILLKLINK